jgi:hypothetical protein
VTFAEELAADRRLVILRALTEAPGGAMNEDVCKTALGVFGHKVSGDLVRGDLHFLGAHSLIRLEKIAAARGELWIAQITGSGADVAEGTKTYRGVARLRPE